MMTIVAASFVLAMAAAAVFRCHCANETWLFGSDTGLCCWCCCYIVIRSYYAGDRRAPYPLLLVALLLALFLLCCFRSSSSSSLAVMGVIQCGSPSILVTVVPADTYR